MWIFDLGSALVATLLVAITAIVALRRYNKRKNPPLSVEEKTKYYESLNERLRREMEG